MRIIVTSTFGLILELEVLELANSSVHLKLLMEIHLRENRRHLCVNTQTHTRARALSGNVLLRYMTLLPFYLILWTYKFINMLESLHGDSLTSDLWTALFLSVRYALCLIFTCEHLELANLSTHFKLSMGFNVFKTEEYACKTWHVLTLCLAVCQIV